VRTTGFAVRVFSRAGDPVESNSDRQKTAADRKPGDLRYGWSSVREQPSFSCAQRLGLRRLAAAFNPPRNPGLSVSTESKGRQFQQLEGRHFF
jgi:hypothetical protein